MARRTRCADAGYVYHVLNRAVGRATLFDKSADYAAFEKVLRQAWVSTGIRLLAFVIRPNHGHLVVWPQHDGARPNLTCPFSFPVRFFQGFKKRLTVAPFPGKVRQGEQPLPHSFRVHDSIWD